MRLRSRVSVFLAMAGLASSCPAAPVDKGDSSPAFPMTYVIAARGMASGTVLTEITFSCYHLFDSPSPSGVLAREESVVETRFRFYASAGRAQLWIEPGTRRFRWDLGAEGEITEWGWTDTWLGLQILPPAGESFVRLGIAGMLLLPTGRDDGGRPGDFSTGGTDYALMSLCDVDLSRFFGSGRCVVYLNLGYRWHGNDEDGSRVWPDAYPAVPVGEPASFNNQMLLRLGWRYSARGVSLETEFRGDRFIHARDRMGLRENPVSLNAGLRKWFGACFWMRLGGEVAFSKGDPESQAMADPLCAFPDWVVSGSMGWGWGSL